MLTSRVSLTSGSSKYMKYIIRDIFFSLRYYTTMADFKSIVREIQAYAKQQPSLACYADQVDDLDEAQLIFTVFMQDSANVKLSDKQLIAKYCDLCLSYGVNVKPHLTFLEPRLIKLRQLCD